MRTAIVPDSAEMWSGVFPSDMAKLVSAPDLSNILVHFSPRDSSIRDAMCNGVSPIAPPEYFKNASYEIDTQFSKKISSVCVFTAQGLVCLPLM